MSNPYLHIVEIAKKIGRPVCILDTETTGLGKPAQVGIVDFAAITIHPDGQVVEFESLIKSDIPIDPGASKIHGILPEHIESAPPFSEIAYRVRKIYDECVVSGFNSHGYDTPIIMERLRECGGAECAPGQHLDVRAVWTNGNKFGKGKLTEVAEKYGVTVENAHRAMGDVKMTAGILEAMLKTHGDAHVLLHMNPLPADLQAQISKASSPANPAAAPGAPNAPAAKAKQTPKPKVAPKEERVLDLIRTMPKPVLREHYFRIGKKLSMTDNSVSFAISILLERKQIEADDVRNPDETRLIVGLLPQILKIEQKRVGEGVKLKLTPIMHNLVNDHGVQSDFVQLRIAMADLDAANRAQPKETCAPTA